MEKIIVYKKDGFQGVLQSLQLALCQAPGAFQARC